MIGLDSRNEKRAAEARSTPNSSAAAIVIPERDVSSRIAAPGKDPARTLLEEVMTPNPVVLQKSDPLAWALHRMGVATATSGG